MSFLVENQKLTLCRVQWNARWQTWWNRDCCSSEIL